MLAQALSITALLAAGLAMPWLSAAGTGAGAGVLAVFAPGTSQTQALAALGRAGGDWSLLHVGGVPQVPVLLLAGRPRTPPRGAVLLAAPADAPCSPHGTALSPFER